MFFTMLFKTQNIVQMMHLTMLIAHPYCYSCMKSSEYGEDESLTALMHFKEA